MTANEMGVELVCIWLIPAWLLFRSGENFAGWWLCAVCVLRCICMCLPDSEK